MSDHEPTAAAFWTFVSANSERLFQAVATAPGDVVEELGEVLREACPGLVCEVSQGQDDPYAEMIISADGKVELLEAVEAAVAAAPDLPRWKVTAFRQRGRVSDGIAVKYRDAELAVSDLSFRIFGGPRGQLGVSLYVRGLKEDETDPRAAAAVLLLDHAIGERDAMTAVQSLRVEPLPDPPAGDFRPLAELPGVIDEVKDQGLDQWETFLTRLDEEGTPASVFVKLGVATVGPQRHRPARVRVIVPLAEPREDGLTTRDEVALLWELEDALVPALAEASDALYVGRVTTRGVRDFVFYAPAGELLEVHAQRVFAPYPQYQVDVQADDDPDWSFYFELLLPDAFESLEISVRNRLQELEEDGDDLDRPRPIEFALEFESDQGRAALLAAAAAAGFAADGLEEDDGLYYATVRQGAPARHDDVMRLVHELYARLQEGEGQLCGWDCPPAGS